MNKKIIITLGPSTMRPSILRKLRKKKIDSAAQSLLNRIRRKALIEITNLYKIFGKKTNFALKSVKEGMSKDELLEIL